MKKRYIIFALLAGLAIGAVAQQQVFIVGSDTLPSNAHICLAHDGTSTITVKFVTGNLNNKDKTFSYWWSTLGDLEIVGTNKADSSVTVRSSNLGKGAVRLHYNIDWCGSYVDLHIYKEFSPADFGLVIEGPDCLTKGETVVFSVRPVLTRNLSANIGVDNYYWNLTSDNPPAFVDSIIYAAGDGSAVTFRVGDVGTGDEVVVNFGDCNRETSKSVRKPLGKIPPKPQVVENLCVPCGQGKTRVISVLNPMEGVDYKCIAPSQWDVVSKNISADAVSFTVQFDSISSDDLTVTAAFRDEEACGESFSYVHITRTWGEGAYMAYNNSATGSCCAVVNGSTKYDFSVQGQIPTGALINWKIPAGWVAEDDNPYSRYRKIRPTAAVALTDTIMAWSEACDQTEADTVWMPVYVKPAAVTGITVDEACLSPNTAYTFHAVQGTNAPQAASYTWQVKVGNAYVNKSDFTGDSLVLIVTTDMQAVRVRPNGLGGCDGTFSSDKALVFKPAAPEGIEADGCIAYNMPDTVTFSIVNPVANQQYEWTLPAGWSKVNNSAYTNGQSIDVRTTGAAGTYTVSAYGVGTGTCGNSEPATINATINSVEKSIIYTAATELFSVSPTRPRGTNYYWYLVYNGHIVGGDNVFYDNDNTALAVSLSDDYFDLSENLINSTEYTLVLEFEVSSGCKARLTYGAPLNPAIDYKNTTPVSPLRTQRYMKTRRIEDALNSPTLLVSPNPVSHTLEVKLNDESEFSVKILSVDAEPLYTDDTMLKQHSIDVSSYPTGTYIVLAFQDGKRVAMQRFIKQ